MGNNQEQENNWGMSCGLWEKRSAKSGNKYYNGKITIDGKDYWINMFLNEVKMNDKSPDFRIYLTETQETIQEYGQSIRKPKYEKKPFDQKQYYRDNMRNPRMENQQQNNEKDIFEDYGEMVEIDDNFLL